MQVKNKLNKLDNKMSYTVSNISALAFFREILMALR